MCIIKTGVMNMDYTLMLCGKDAFSYFFLSTWRRPPRSWAKWQKPAKKLDEKIREIDWPYLYIEQFDKFLTWRTDRKRKLNLLKTCLKKNSWSHIESSVNIFSAGFSHLEPLCTAAADSSADFCSQYTFAKSVSGCYFFHGLNAFIDLMDGFSFCGGR